MTTPSRVCLIILDGWGLGRKDHSNAILEAYTPFMDSLEKTAPHSSLKTYGEFVGLPDGQMGNSEVGHMNIGAGRVVYQDLVKINLAIKNKSFFREEVLVNALNHAKSEGKKVHLMGLVSDGGVHSSQDHLHALLDLCKTLNVPEYVVHAFTDGRDCDPKSGLGFIRKLQDHMRLSGGKLASVIGRYYAMDRDKRWERIREAYDLLTAGKGRPCLNLIEEIEHAYEEGITDEFIPALCGVDQTGEPIGLIQENDLVICFNFRTDRCREITMALTQQEFPEFGMKPLSLNYVTMTNYDPNFRKVKVVYDKDNLTNTLGEVISDAGLRQIRIAETEKYPHVTFFFSGGREQPFNGEERILVNSPKVATYDLQPEMSAPEVTAKIVSAIQEKTADFICLNFANPDMVGHTGVYEAIVKACETTDACAEKVAAACLKNGYKVLITADHGNADFAVNDDGSPNTAHTTNPVPLYLLGDETHQLQNGILADLAPTVLELMGLKQPPEMTGKSLLKSR